MQEFTLDEQKVLSPFVTNLDSPIFALRNMPEVVMGAMFSRYSRTTKSLRRVLLDEFIQNKEMGFSEIVAYSGSNGSEQIIATKKAEEFYDRVLVGYGDDSVAELGGAHIACEQVSMIASKFLEDPRIGISPLEKSTRYVYFNQKTNGKYSYYRGFEFLDSNFADEYLKTNDMLFDAYSKLMDPLGKYIMEKFPKDSEISDRAYQSTIRAKVCDSLRGLLPASALTNLGLFGNGRAFEYLMLKMFASNLPENNAIANGMHSELSKIIPSFVKRANDSHAKATQEYLKNTKEAISKIANEKLSIKPDRSPEVALVNYDADAEDKILSAMLYSHADLPLSQIKLIVSKLSNDERKNLIFEYLSRRQNRRHKPGRSLENAHYTFDFLANFGQYRDLQRHRMLTLERQLLTCNHGFDLPNELIEGGFDLDFKESMQSAKDAYDSISKHSKDLAQYVVPLAYKYRWYAKMNLREVAHLTELRSMQQGHPDYRRVAQKMFFEVQKVHPEFAKYIKFVDLKDYGLERLEAEKKQDKKLEDLKKKYG
ncbi:FAD-dependent thymidylate synthase [Candidatus Micrarchaeota archaeon]|nr:FAD-dependent thymidylate synthase [Candidatus Micrarchaeota archaeon]